MHAEIIAVGSELLTSSRIDTNSLFVTERLNELGIDVRAKAVVGDDSNDLAALFRQALDRADLVILTGGLGPTDDDVTRDVVASVLGLPMTENPEVVDRLRRRFESRKLKMPEINRRQAMVPEGAIVLDNPNGTAPGLLIVAGTRRVLLLPGPPRELKPMFERVLSEHLAPHAGSRRFYRRVLRITGRSESHVEQAAQPSYQVWRERRLPIDTTILAAFGQIELHLRVSADSRADADAILDAAARDLHLAIGPDIYSDDGRLLEQVVGDLLVAHKLSIALAESCTGGLLASRLTDVPGSSRYVERGIVAYSNRAKIELLGVDEHLIREHGAVSEPVARAMAEGIRQRAGADIGVAITGIAGPDGGSDAKPVGTVMIATAGVGEPAVRTFRFFGDREQVKFQASQAALDMVRRRLVDYHG
jgi:competence/damage-inducible protein CinA-like protein